MSRLPLRALAIAALATAACAGTQTPLRCERPETIALHVMPATQLNQDREGFARSVVLRSYQLHDTRGFRATSFERLWSTPFGAATHKDAADEWIALPGRHATRALRRDPKATHLAIAANFREHYAESGWRAVVRLPEPLKKCPAALSQPALALDVVLSNYALEVR